MSPRRALVALVTALAPVALVAPGLAAPAAAEVYHHRDATRDVNDSTDPPCPTCFPVAPAPRNRTEDILGFGVAYGASALHLRVGTRSVPRSARVPEVAWSVRTPAGLALIVVVEVTDAGRARVHVRGGGARCADATARFVDRPRRWTVELSPACLRDASSVRVGAVTNGADETGRFNDDALLGRPTCCTAPALTPPVRRG